MFRLSLLLTITLTGFSPLIHAVSYMGMGVDKSLAQAKQLALADLQQNLLVNVETHTHLARGSNSAGYFQLTSKVSSHLQLIGTRADCIEMAKEHHCSVQLGEPQRQLYENKIRRLQRQINDNWQVISSTQGDEKLNLLNNTLILFDQFKSLLAVYELLGKRDTSLLPKVNETNIKRLINDIKQKPNSLDELAIAIAAPLKQYKRIYVSPFTPVGSLEVTPFSRALKHKVMAQLDVIADKNYAFYQLSGSYTFEPDHLAMQNHLIALVREKQGKIEHASSHVIAVTKLAPMRFQPEQKSFDKELVKQQIIGHEFNVQLTTNHGARDLMFEAPQTLKLMVKLNQPGYFYLVGHTQSDNKKQSYLLDLNDASGPQKFLHYVGVEQINRWNVIGEFQVTAPFGTESLQVFATLDYPETALPATRFDGTYHLIAGTAEQVVQKTRGLVRTARLHSQPSPIAAPQNAKAPKTEAPITPLAKQNVQLSENTEEKSQPQLEIRTQKNRVAEAVIQFSTFEALPSNRHID